MASPYKYIKVTAKYSSTLKGFNDAAVVGTIRMTTEGELRPFPTSFSVAGKTYTTKEEQSKTERGNSAVYVGFAINCLCRIDKAIKELSKESNTYLLTAINSLQVERKRLINEEPAFKRAEEILTDIKDIEAGEK